jgi:hypothetical protein
MVSSRKTLVPAQSNSAQSSALAVGLFYAAALLPDPDLPCEVAAVQLHTWLISLAFEGTLLYGEIHRWGVNWNRDSVPARGKWKPQGSSPTDVYYLL